MFFFLALYTNTVFFVSFTKSLLFKTLFSESGFCGSQDTQTEGELLLLSF